MLRLGEIVDMPAMYVVTNYYLTYNFITLLWTSSYRLFVISRVFF